MFSFETIKMFLDVRMYTCVEANQCKSGRMTQLSNRENNFAARRNVTSNLDFVIPQAWDVDSVV